MAPLPPLRALRRRPAIVILLVVALVSIGIRAALPTVVTRYVNGVLNDLPGYEGRLEDVDLHLWRGAYTIHGLAIEKLERQRRIPIFAAPRIELSLEWGELLNGALVGEIEFRRPEVNVLAGPVRKDEARATDDLVQRFRELLPVNVNRFAVVGGELHFRDYAADPDVDVYLRDVSLVARNLTNSAQVSETLAATVSAEGRVMKTGRFKLDMRIDPFASQPTFDLAFDLRRLSLPELNDYLRHYLAVVARDGRLSLYAEAKARDGGFRGYVKPFVEDLDILKVKQERSLGEAIKGFFVKLVANVFENKPQEQLASKIEFSGKFDDPDVSVWQAVTTFLRNAFVQALTPGVEGSVAPERARRLKGEPAAGEDRGSREERRTEKERRELEEKRAR